MLSVARLTVHSVHASASAEKSTVSAGLSSVKRGVKTAPHFQLLVEFRVGLEVFGSSGGERTAP